MELNDDDDEEESEGRYDPKEIAYIELLFTKLTNTISIDGAKHLCKMLDDQSSSFDIVVNHEKIDKELEEFTVKDNQQ